MRHSNDIFGFRPRRWWQRRAFQPPKSSLCSLKNAAKLFSTCPRSSLYRIVYLSFGFFLSSSRLSFSFNLLSFFCIPPFLSCFQPNSFLFICCLVCSFRPDHFRPTGSPACHTIPPHRPSLFRSTQIVSIALLIPPCSVPSPPTTALAQR